MCYFLYKFNQYSLQALQTSADKIYPLKTMNMKYGSCLIFFMTIVCILLFNFFYSLIVLAEKATTF